MMCITFFSLQSHAGSKKLRFGSPESAGMDSEKIKQVAQNLQVLVDEERLAGMVTIAARHGKIVHYETMGYQDIATKTPMEKDTIFRVYSMSKPITGVAMMMLFEEKKFRLSDPVEKYIPEFADMQVYVGLDDDGNMITEPANSSITIRQLMNHTAGFGYGTMMGNHPVHVMLSEANNFDADSSLQDMITKMSTVPLLFQPGTNFSYSASVDIQGYLVEKLSGQRFGEFLQERIFEPLEMNDTAFYVPVEKHDRLAEVYHYDINSKLVEQELYGNVIRFKEEQMLEAGGWGLVSTAMDYLRFSQMLLNGGKLDGVRLLKPKTVRMMRTNQLPEHLVNNLDPLLGGQPGASFGLNFGIVEDPEGNPVGGYSKGEYYWGGAAGTWFWIDPVEDLVFVGMVQQFAGQPQIPDVRMISKHAFYQAITDSESDDDDTDSESDDDDTDSESDDDDTDSESDDDDTDSESDDD